MSQVETRTGGCQCGRVRYEVTLDMSAPVNSCNCSMCGRAGTLLAFVPDNQFKLLSGEENLTDYQFNKKHIHHLFCNVCGIKPFARGVGPQGPTVAVNARCLDDVRIDDLNVNFHDGKSR